MTNTENSVDVVLTERQARGIANLIETGHRAYFRGIVDYGPPAEFLSESEMADLELRLRRALGEKP